MTTYLSSSFSLNMLAIGPQGLCAEIKPVDPGNVPADAVSVIGHANTAELISRLLQREVQVNRTSVTMDVEDVLYVAQFRGSRLPEGAISLPEDAIFEFYRLTIRA